MIEIRSLTRALRAASTWIASTPPVRRQSEPAARSRAATLRSSLRQGTMVPIRNVERSVFGAGDFGPYLAPNVNLPNK
jgi:hypothetical protein